MPKYINADDIKNDIKTLWDWETVDGIKSSAVLKQVLSDIDNTNEAVVRCKDCVHRNSHWCEWAADDDYCSYGERREDNASD